MCAIPSEETAPGTDETFTAYELANALAGRVGLADAADVIAGLLRRLIPADLCAFYMHDCRSGELEAQYIVGDGWGTIQGLRIELGQRLSGWVAANRLSIVNSDAALDLGDQFQFDFAAHENLSSYASPFLATSWSVSCRYIRQNQAHSATSTGALSKASQAK